MKNVLPRKICAVMESLPELTSPALLEQVEILGKMGFSIQIVSLKTSEPQDRLTFHPRLRAEIDYLEFSPGKIIPGLLTALLLMLITPIKTIKAFVKMLKFLFEFRERGEVIKNYFQAVLMVNQHILNKEITHIHSQASLSAARTAILAAEMTGLSLSFIALPGEIYNAHGRLLKYILQEADFILTISKYDQNYIIKNIFNAQPDTPTTLCFLNGINLDFFQFKKRIKPAQEPFKIITTACLTRKKGIDVVLRALYILKQQGIKFNYQIVGDGPEKTNLQQLAAELGLTDAVEFAGQTARYKISKLLENADLFVIAPRILDNGERDAIPTGMLEAMAMGVPVTVTRLPGIEEVIEDEETGLLVSPENPEAFAAACLRLLTDSELQQMIIMKARLYIEGCRDIHQQAKNFIEFINTHDLRF
ncbi:MAG: glycosyltransferase [Victivallaceae bacterium]